MGMPKQEVRHLRVPTIHKQFFACDGRRQLSLETIVKCAWVLAYSGMNAEQAARASRVSKDTAVRWFSKFRNVCSSVEMTLPLMTGTREKPIQVDESYFSVLRKCNRGRSCIGNKRASTKSVAREELKYNSKVGGRLHLNQMVRMTWLIREHREETMVTRSSGLGW